jgi:hypothetical protein
LTGAADRDHRFAMRDEPTCPRCGGPLVAPGLRSSAWTCPLHAAVAPLQPPEAVTAPALVAAARGSGVPLWAPWPLPPAWLVTGIRVAGDGRGPFRAAALAVSGPAPLGGVADLVLVAEEPGVGLGAHLAGLPGPDPGPGFDAGAPSAKVEVDGRPCALWEVAGEPDRSAFVGEAVGCWLWAVVWPETAGLVVQDQLSLLDLRDPGHSLDLPLGAPSPRI